MNGTRLKDGQWKGQPAYIVGGGESLKSFDWALLRGRSNVIVINRAFLDVPDAAVWFSEDLRVVELYGKRPEWKAFAGVKVFHALTPTFGRQALDIDPSIHLVPRLRQDKYWSQSMEDGLALSSNSGVGAMNLAWILGADPIFLLGFDCRSRNLEQANYHEDYEKAGLERTGAHQYQSFKSDFETWVAPQVRDRRVFNLVDMNFPSAIESWARWDRDSFLKTGRPCKVIVRFTRETGFCFEAVEEQSTKFELDLGKTGKFLPISEFLGGGQEAVRP